MEWSGATWGLGRQTIKVIEKELELEYSLDLDQTILAPELLTEEWWLRRNIRRTNEVLRIDWFKPELVDEKIVIRAIDPAPGFRRYGQLSPHMYKSMAEMLNDVGVMTLICRTRESMGSVLSIQASRWTINPLRFAHSNIARGVATLYQKIFVRIGRRELLSLALRRT